MARIKIEDLPSGELNDEEMDRVAGGLDPQFSPLQPTSTIFSKHFVENISLTGTNFNKV
jgi:hypothetical protein